MLSRTADSLYWIARYVERADFVARILDAAPALRLPARRAMAATASEWESALASAGAAAAFYAQLRRSADERTVCDFLAFSPRQPVLDPRCLDRRPRQRPRGAHRADLRDVGGDQRAPGSSCSASTAQRMTREELAASSTG